MKKTHYKIGLTSVALLFIFLNSFVQAAAVQGSVSGAVKNKDHKFSISITDSKLQQQYQINDATLLNRFNYYWSQKHPVLTNSRINFQWRYQLAIKDNNSLNKWVYDPQGYVKKISIQKSTVVYKISAARSFNRFLSSLESSSQ